MISGTFDSFESIFFTDKEIVEKIRWEIMNFFLLNVVVETSCFASACEFGKYVTLLTKKNTIFREIRSFFVLLFDIRIEICRSHVSFAFK